MKVELLYFSGCPNYGAALQRLLAVLSEEQVSASVTEVQVTDENTATRMRFPGSPTIRIDGVDVEPSARTARYFGLACRTYVDGGQREGVPPTEWIRAVVREARDRQQNAPRK